MNLFTDLINRDSQKFTYDVSDKYTTDLSVIGSDSVSDTSRGKWVAVDCGKHARLSSTFKVLVPNCQMCKHNEEIPLILEKVEKIVDRIDSKTYVVKLKCGHEKTMASYDIKKKPKLNCLICREEEIRIQFEKAGLELLGKSVNGGTNRHCKFTECGHTRDLQIALVLTNPGKQVCKVCNENRFKAEAESSGLSFIGEADNKNQNYRKYRTKCCGEVKDVQVSHVRSLAWACSQCSDGYYRHPSNLYVLHIKLAERDVIKLGYSRYTKYRFKSYGLPSDAVVNVLFSVPTQTRGIASNVEKSLHRHFKDKRLDPVEMKEYFTISGFTECYPLSIKSELLSELQIKLKDALSSAFEKETV